MDRQQWRPLPNRWAPVSAPLQNLCICLGVLEDSDGPVSAFCPRRLVQAHCLEADQGLKGRKRREAGEGKQGLGRPSTGIWGLLSCPCTHPSLLGSHLYLSPMGAPRLLKLSSPLVQIHFSTRQTRAGPAFPFTPTGWLSAAMASALVRKIKKEARDATAPGLPAGWRLQADFYWEGTRKLAWAREDTDSPLVLFPKREGWLTVWFPEPTPGLSVCLDLT